MELYSDIYYVRRIQAGDTSGFACLLDRYSRPVYSLIFKLVRNKEDAEELAQDVFMKVFRSLGTFRAESSLSTWIYKIAYHTAISEIRKKKHEFLAIDEALIENVSEEKLAETFGTNDENEQINRLDAAMAALSPDEQAILLFFYTEEKSIEDIASITGLSLSNVKTRLHRIRKKLFVLLTKMEEQENE
ncbi:MAG: sigma-70 family RNA polymerase sigma factor [Tannerellaceae bacterium]|jgi:RNA polymerase sigma-70 factor (ECF subfamily)|nr:sigma-70 family RNA polymerase sigma factor [Tannerellaceae bacterium]